MVKDRASPDRVRVGRAPLLPEPAAPLTVEHAVPRLTEDTMRRTLWRIVVLAVITWCASPHRVIAQQRTLGETRPGERVQLVLRDSLRQGPLLPARQTVMGQFLRATADSVWIRPHGASELAVARPVIRHARVSRGTSRLRSALLLGVGWGLGFGASVAVNQLDEHHDHRGRDVVIGAGVGLGAGVLLGAVRPYEHWRRTRR